jgi:hypothetical protein
MNGSDEQTAGAAGEEKQPVDLYEVLGYMLQQLTEVSWQKLGLQPDYITGKIEPDLTQAKLGIDVISHVASLIEPKLDEADRRVLNNTVRDLRLNYVNRVNS